MRILLALILSLVTANPAHVERAASAHQLYIDDQGFIAKRIIRVVIAKEVWI